MDHRHPATEALLHAGIETVDVSDDARYAAAFDNTRLAFWPEAVVRPRDEATLARVLRLANERGVPVTVRGAGSATTGATAPIDGGWVVDLSGWTALEVDPERGIATAQPGVTTLALQEAAAAVGWFYPPDPSSAKYCTIGGNLACNAGGMRGGKYGVTRDYVMALRGLLPTGEAVRWGAPLRKFAAGYNLRDLWIGSEGTLGIITAATLRLVPAPAHRWTGLAAFTDEDQAADAVRKLLARRIVPSICEFLDRATVACTVAYTGAPVFPGLDESALILLELDGHPAAVDDDRKAVEAWARETGAQLHAAADEETVARLWSVRRQCSQAMFQLGDSKLNEDVVVPPAAYGPLLAYTRELAAETGLATPTFGHAADGNFHVHIMYNRGDPDACQRAEAGIGKLMRKVVDLGGAISGEHGIGLAKTPFLRLQHGEAEIKAMQAVKQALDPNGILNPGKIFTPVRVWEFTPEEVTLPWDHARHRPAKA